MTIDEAEIAFRPLLGSDIANMAAWLGDPDVSPWYEEGSTDPAVLAETYASIIAGTEPTRGYIASVEGIDVGYIQAVPLAGYPDYAAQLDLPTGTIGIDLFIGAADYRGHGYGTAILRAFTHRIVFGIMGASHAVIGPAPDNARAIRSYEKAGYTWLKTVSVRDDDEPWNAGDEYVMVQQPPQRATPAHHCGMTRA